MNDRQSNPGNQNARTFFLLSGLVIAALGAGFVLSCIAGPRVSSQQGFVRLDYRIRPDDLLLRRARAFPVGTPKAAVEAALRSSNGWGYRDRGALGYDLAYYPDSAYEHHCAFSTQFPFIQHWSSVPLKSKAVVVHLDASMRLVSVEPETREWPEISSH